MHNLGIEHHQIRTDREDFLIGATDLILDDTNSRNFSIPFDYGSVMQYGSQGTPRYDNLYRNTLGNDQGPSFNDIKLINKHYGCTCANPTVTCQNGGYPNPNNCGTCICQYGFGGTTCNTVDPGTEGKSDIITVSETCQTFKKEIGPSGTTEYPYNQKAWFHFKAPAGKKVQIVITNYKAGWYGQGCSSSGIELKMAASRFDRTGYL